MRISQFYFYTRFAFACKNQHLMPKAPTDKDNTPDKKLGDLRKQKKTKQQQEKNHPHPSTTEKT